jgi:hypothetical protein
LTIPPEEFTERYRQLLDHYGLEATHSQAGEQLVERALHQLLEQGRRIRAEQVEEVLQEQGGESERWRVEIYRVEQSVYDRLLGTPKEVRT